MEDIHNIGEDFCFMFNSLSAFNKNYQPGLRETLLRADSYTLGGLDEDAGFDSDDTSDIRAVDFSFE